MYYIYVLKSLKRKYIYVGISDNPERRIEQHNFGYNRTTNPCNPFRVIMVEKFNTRARAREREKYLKSGFGKEYLKSMI